MKASIVFFDSDNNPKVGDEFYLVELTFNNHGGEQRLDAHSEPQRKNMSGEICVNGWLGETDNVNKYALGKHRVVKVFKTQKGKYFLDGVKVKTEKIE